MALSKINQLIKTKTDVFKFSPVMSSAKIKCEPQNKKKKNCVQHRPTSWLFVKIRKKFNIYKRFVDS